MTSRLFFILWVVLGAQMASAQTTTVIAGERLSHWLARQSSPLEYPIGLAWRVPEERTNQSSLKQALLDSLSEISQKNVNARLLSSWIEMQSVTGRVILPSADSRWLEANPAQDPILATNQMLHAIPRPLSVTVLLSDGGLCQALHTAGATAKSYIDICEQGGNHPQAWIAQPDGRVSTYGVAAWNAETQSEIAPGAWIWAPDTRTDFSVAFSDGLIRFLGSIGPQADVKDSLKIDRPRQTPGYLIRNSEISASDWGEVGLIQTPTARMAPAGSMRVGISKVLPYTWGNVIFQPADWLEAGFRYIDIGNRLYDSSGTLQTNQTYKDKSFDVKVKLREESSYGPAVALGVRDIGGTGLFSSEYVVANKRWGDFDGSLGIAWGYMGSSGNIGNPLGRLSSDFYARPNAATASGGTVGTNAFFRGSAGIFGGIQWRVSDALTYKLERGANDYQHEPFNNIFMGRSPWNFAANYRYSPYLDLSTGWERGNTLMVGVSFHAKFDEFDSPKMLNPPVPKYRSAPPASTQSYDDLKKEILAQTGWQLLSLEEKSAVLTLRMKAGGVGMHKQERLNRLNGVLQAHAEQHIKRWVIVFVEQGLVIDAAEINRDAWIEQNTQALPPSLKKESVVAYQPHMPVSPELMASEQMPSRFIFGVGPSYNHILGGPDAFYLYRIGVAASAAYQITPQTLVQGVVDHRVVDNFENFKYTAPSSLPRVRTFMREYQTGVRTTMPLLQITHVASPAANHFISVYGGMLESMAVSALARLICVWSRCKPCVST
jgi:Exopolysaccharide biosynthesis protein YbjH/Capsule biosynthesis GfcC